MSKTKSVVDVNGVRYELMELLGRGGQGAVYAVKGGRLAVKLVAGHSQWDRERLRNQITHVRRLPIGELSLSKPLEMLRPPHTGYVMELITGMVPIRTLLTPPKGEPAGVEWYMRTGGLRRRLLVLSRAAHTLAQLHGKGLAYSDPSPTNIFISEDPSFAEVWFVDTDNLRYESSPGTHAGVYTPSYGAPELVQGKSGVTTLTDVHAFAVIAFQVLSLAHPFIGNYVNEGDPELEEQAFAGLIPWVDDVADDRNRASFGIPREWVLSSRLKEAFEQTFGAGRVTPSKRPGAAEWAERLFAAADATIPCTECRGAFYFDKIRCTWCDAERPTFATAVFHLWDPSHGPDGGVLTKPQRGEPRPVIVGHGAMTSTARLIITRRLAFDIQGRGADEPVVEASLSHDRVSLRSLDGRTYTLYSPSGDRQTVVTDRPQPFHLVQGQASWRLHFGDMGRLHRVLSFELRPGRGS
jgi:DNA-binding helix-hairpin-helix protein with protein kinase domain